jgi:hypothetical protein
MSEKALQLSGGKQSSAAAWQTTAAAWQTTRNQLITAAMAMKTEEGDSKIKELFTVQLTHANACLAEHIRAGATTGGRFPRVDGVPQCPGAPVKKRKFGEIVVNAAEQLHAKERSIQTLYRALENIHATLKSAQSILEGSRFTTEDDRKLFEQLVKLFRAIAIVVHVMGEPNTAYEMVCDLCRLAATGGVMYYPLRELHTVFVEACAPIKSPFHDLE